MRLACAAAAALAALIAPGPAVAQPDQRGAPEQPLPNPFAGFESVRLPNGMRLWYGHLPGATVTSMAVVVPYGRDRDPHGQEEIAHFLEHALLSDRSGRTEAELARELTARGGQHNAFTGHSATVFMLNIATAEAAYGVRWLHDVVAPRTLAESVVERNREPVAIEINARRRHGLTGIAARYLLHPRLLPPGFWRREFGLDAQEERGADHAATIAAITPAALQAFHDLHYAPSEMTLVIVGGASPGVLEPAIEQTFATLLWRPPPPAPTPLQVRQAESRRFTWSVGGSTRIAIRYRIAELNGRDQLRLIFIEDLLRYRLMERLRRGGDKSAYGIAAVTAQRGSGAAFAIMGDLSPSHERAARAIIEDEIDRLRDAAADTVAFYADRDVLSRRLRIENASTVALRNWAVDRFARPDLHAGFPDLGEYYATVGPDSIAALAGRLFRPENRVLEVRRPIPAPLALLILLSILPMLAAARLYRRLVIQPVDMTRIRYVTRLRPHPVARMAGTVICAAIVMISIRAAAAAMHLAADRWLLRVDSFWLLAGMAGIVIFGATLAACAAAGLLLHKVMVFDDALILKSPTYRAIRIPRDRISGVSLPGQSRVRLRRPSLPPVRNGVVVELDDGSGYLLQVARPAEFIRALGDAARRDPGTAVSALVHGPDQEPAPVTAQA
jgi:predicted Zn-dependent peptidase